MNSHKENTVFYWFDFGGVLSPPITTLFDFYYEKTSIPASQLQAAMKLVANDMGLPTLAPIESAILTEREWGMRLRSAIEQLFPATQTNKARLEEFGQQWFSGVLPNTAIVQCVKDMQKAGLRTGILTNNVVEWQPYWQAMLGLNDVVEHIVDSCKVQCRKPEHKFFAIAEQIAGVEPQQCVLVDDLAENCLSAGQRGWKVIQFINNQDCLEKLHRLIGGKP